MSASAILTRIHQLVFSKELRIDGWTQHHIKLLHNLLWKHAILLESLYGITSCTENVEYSLHMAKDIERHSTLDNYWCYVYERLVRFYKQQTTNMKSLCKTFADRAQQLQVVSTYLESHCEQSTSHHNFSLELIAKPPVLLQAKTEETGIALKEFLSMQGELPSSVQEAYDSGIFWGQ